LNGWFKMPRTDCFFTEKEQVDYSVAVEYLPVRLWLVGTRTSTEKHWRLTFTGKRVYEYMVTTNRPSHP